MAAHILAPIASLNTTLLTTVVHPTYFPYPLLSTLHAARVSLVHRALSKRAQDGAKPGEKKQVTWAYDIAGYLIMCWGGALLTSYILGQPPIQILSFQPLINYLAVYFVTLVYLQFISAPTAKFIDTTLIIIDGALRMQPIIGSIGMATTHASPTVKNSLLIQLLLGTIGATGGGQLAGTLGIHSPTGWSLQTPPCLRATHLVEVIDVVMAFFCTLLYGLTTLSHPSYVPILASVYGNAGKPLFSPLGARAACTLLFSAGFAYRAVVLHWLPATTVVNGIPDGMKTKVNGATATTTRRK